MFEVGYLYGKRVIISNMITKDVQVRKHKKKRINKKWLKRYGYKCVPDNEKVYVVSGTLFMTKGCYQRIKKVIEKGNPKDFITYEE